MKKLLITALLGLSLISCSQNKNFVKQGDVFNFQDYLKASVIERHIGYGGIYTQVAYDLNKNDKIDHIATYNTAIEKKDMNYAIRIVKLKKEISETDIKETGLVRENVEYFLEDKDGDHILEQKRIPKEFRRDKKDEELGTRI